MPSLPEGQRSDDGVVVRDAQAAARLHDRHRVGSLRGGVLHLHLVEAAWLVAEGRLSVAEAPDALHLLQAGAADALVQFLAMAELRNRGLQVHWSGTCWTLRDRDGAASTPLVLRSERDPTSGQDLLLWSAAGSLLAIVDDDGAVTYYKAAPAAPKGSCAPGELGLHEGTPLADRVLVDDAPDLRRERIGQPSLAGVVLSLVEAEALRRRGALRLPAGFEAARSLPELRVTLPAYEALRAAGVVAKSGFKFGTHLRGYRSDPDAEHADWLVQCVHAQDVVQWPELARAVRVAHGVRKSLLVAVVAPDAVAFVALSWFKP